MVVSMAWMEDPQERPDHPRTKAEHLRAAEELLVWSEAAVGVGAMNMMLGSIAHSLIGIARAVQDLQ